MKRIFAAVIVLGFLAAASDTFGIDKTASSGTNARSADTSQARGPLGRLVDRARLLVVHRALDLAISSAQGPRPGVRRIQCSGVRMCMDHPGDNGCWWDQDGILHCNELPAGPCGGQDYQDPGNTFGGY